MLLRHSLGLASEAEAVESAVEAALKAGARTADLTKTDALSTTQMTDKILSHL
jgi:3-isopropylmalate dehydrogenase